MFRISVVCEKNDLEKSRAALKLSEFRMEFVDKDEFKNTEVEEDMALIVLPWNGFKEIFECSNFKKYLEQKSVVVVGPALYFFEVEKWVIDGSVCFLSSPVNSMQIESVINEIVRIRGVTHQEALLSV